MSAKGIAPSSLATSPVATAEVLGARLRAERRRLGLSLVRTAGVLALGSDPWTTARRIDRLERGKRPDLTLASHLAAAFGMSLCELLSGCALERAVHREIRRMTPCCRLRALKLVRRLRAVECRFGSTVRRGGTKG